MLLNNQRRLQAAAERAVFKEFAIRASLDIDLFSIESREPPEPDILCKRRGGKRIAFELVSLSDSDVAEQINRREQEPTSAMFVGGANFEAVRRKFINDYQTDAPIELLCHVGEFLLTPEEFVLYDLKEEIRSASVIPFQRIWFMGEEVCLVWLQ